MADPTTPRVALVTGAARGIGLATARWFLARGWRVAITDKDAAALAASHAELEQESPGRVIAPVCDVSDPAQVQALVDVVDRAWGRIDALVNNAGISMIQAALDTPSATYRKVLDVNLVAPFLLCKAYGRVMVEYGSGSVVNVASVAGLQGVAERSAYNASKHGLIGLTRTLAVEWGGRGVRVNAVCPGWVKTEMDHKDQAGGSYSDADITEHVPMGRFARPQDIAQAIAWLCDAESSGFVNGVALPIDGGWTSDGSWQSLRLRQR